MDANSTMNKTMKTNKTATKLKPGMTLIEITVVILVLLTLIAVLFIGANIYKKGADRAACILNIRNIQQAVRADQNLNNKDATDPIFGNIMPSYMGETEDATLFYFETDLVCPDDGTLYEVETTYPALGELAAKCKTYGDSHAPDDDTKNGW